MTKRNLETAGRSWFTALAGADGAAEIDIYDEIGMWGVTALDFNRDLRAMGQVSAINLRINSPGGEVFDGIAIYNILRRHKARVTVTVDGIAASIASLIAMAADDLVMPENSMMMIHDPSGVVIGTSKDMRELSDALDKVKSSMISAYTQKSNLSADEISQIMSDETWLTAQEAVDLGLADRVESPIKMAACFDLSARFRSVPAGLTAMKPKETQMTDEKTPKAVADPTPAATAVADPAPVVVADPVVADPDQTPTAVADPVVVAVADPAPAATPAPTASADVLAERQRATDIIAACSLAGRPGDAVDFIAKETSLSDAIASLQNARATTNKPDANPINARNGALDQQKPLRIDLAADMRKRFGAKG
jgi:ATP-dependent Clp protease protease subunit